MALRLRDRGFAVAVRHRPRGKRDAGVSPKVRRCAIAGSGCRTARAAIVAVVDAMQDRKTCCSAGVTRRGAAARCRGGCRVRPRRTTPSVLRRGTPRRAGLEAIDADVRRACHSVREGTMSSMVFAAAPGASSASASHQRSRAFRLDAPFSRACRKLRQQLLAGINPSALLRCWRWLNAPVDPALAFDVIERSSGQSWSVQPHAARWPRPSPRPPAL